MDKPQAAKPPSSKGGAPRRESIIGNVGKSSVPLAKTNIVDQWIDYWKRGGKATDDEKDSAATGEGEGDGKTVSIFALLSYSTTKERALMVFGLCMATLSGLGLPAWLILLSMALDRFSDIATLMTHSSGAGLQDLLQQELEKLVIAFFSVGVLSLITGSLYVAIWTYTGEHQSLRIREKFVRSALKQDAEWFDSYDREEIPTMIDSSMMQVNDAIGRQMVDTYSFVVASAGCLGVSFAMNAPLALVMLCVVPFVAVVTIIFGIYVRRASQSSASDSAKAGGLATEVVTGIKTVTALCAQKWALNRYESHSESSRFFSTRSGVLSSVMTGVTGLVHNTVSAIKERGIYFLSYTFFLTHSAWFFSLPIQFLQLSFLPDVYAGFLCWDRPGRE